MATMKHVNWLNMMLGATGSVGTLVDFNTDTIRGALIDSADVTITAALDGYDDISVGLVHATAGLATLTISSITGGVVTLSGPLTFTAVTGDSADYLNVHKNTGTPSTSPLALTWDSASTGLPVTPNGGDITATWGSSVLVTLA